MIAIVRECRCSGQTSDKLYFRSFCYVNEYCGSIAQHWVAIVGLLIPLGREVEEHIQCVVY